MQYQCVLISIIKEGLGTRLHAVHFMGSPLETMKILPHKKFLKYKYKIRGVIISKYVINEL